MVPAIQWPNICGSSTTSHIESEKDVLGTVLPNGRSVRIHRVHMGTLGVEQCLATSSLETAMVSNQTCLYRIGRE